MEITLRRFNKTRTLVLGATTLSLLWLPGIAQSQTAPPQTQQAIPGNGNDGMQQRQAWQGNDNDNGQNAQGMHSDRRLYREAVNFDQFLDQHPEIAGQLRSDPSLLDNQDYVDSHPALRTYRDDHPTMRESAEHDPAAFMQLSEHSAGLKQEATSFAQFLDQHREIAEQIRRDPSLLDNRQFIDSHPALRTFRDNDTAMRQWAEQNPAAFMQLAENDNRGFENGDRDNPGQGFVPERRGDANREAVNFDRFLDQHREIGEQVRRNPSLADDQNFVSNHPALQGYLQDHPGVRDQLSQDPTAFMRQADFDNRDVDGRGRDPMHDRMADFGGFLGNHQDIQRDLVRNAMIIKDRQYVQNHTELDAYLNQHPEVRDQLMANPQDFIHGAQQYSNPTGTNGATSGAGVNVRGTGVSGAAGATGTTGTSTGTSTNPATTHSTKPNQ